MAYFKRGFPTISLLLSWHYNEGGRIQDWWTPVQLTYASHIYAGNSGTSLKIHMRHEATGIMSNMREAMSSQQIFASTLAGRFSGVSTNMSTGYDLGLWWDVQPGYTRDAAGLSIGGGAYSPDPFVGTAYHFYGEDYMAMAISLNTDPDNWQFIINAVAGGTPFYMTSQDAGLGVIPDPFRLYSGSSSGVSFCTSAGRDEHWYPQGIGSDKLISAAHSASDSLGSYESPLLNYSKDNIRGNSVAVPCTPNVVSPDSCSAVGSVKGLRYISMQYLNSEDIVNIGGDDYMVFRIPDKTIGLAFKM